MKIEVHLHTILQQQVDNELIDNLIIDLAEGSNISDLLDYLEIGIEQDALLIAVNGRQSDKKKILSENDTVNLMPAISGG